MSQPGASLYWTALQVSPERIAAMNDRDLNVLMGQLLLAQAYRCGSPPNEIRVNTGEAKDDGCDGWSAKPAEQDQWLGRTDTCWQFKAGSSGEPARLAGEVTRRIPKEALIRGDRYVLVASGSRNGKKGEDDRLAALTADAATAMIPAERIDVIGSERLTNWCNQHPAVAARWAGRPDGLWSLDDWSNSDEHQVPWQASDAVQSELVARRGNLDFAANGVLHLHIQGPPGVGKTRFALELCREATWRNAVVYVRQAVDLRLSELIDGAARDDGVQLVVVADEVQPEQLRPLRDSVGRGGGRVRLITVGHSPSPDPARIPALSVTPLDHKVMRKIIEGWHPAMPPEHIDFVVRFADGYVRLARLAANAVAQNPRMDVRGLLSQGEIRGFLDGMLGEGDRCALYVVAVLTSVGWVEDRDQEGQAVANHLGLDWNETRAAVEGYHRRLGIAPRGGRYRYISPTPLGIYLTAEAWATYPELLKSLPGVLPSDGARDAYYDRLRSMASSPHAQDFAREELGLFFRLGDFIDAGAVRRWSALSSADPDRAANGILQALKGTSLEGRRQIMDGARRETVCTLVRLAWRSSSFHDAVTALALLGEAENETWANNASAEFAARFQVLLGGTAVPYLDRLSVLDELLAEERPALTSLVLRALTEAGRPYVSRMESGPASDELPETEWRPRTSREHLQCVEAAISKMCRIAEGAIADLLPDLVTAAKKTSILLRRPRVREHVASLLDAVRRAYPAAREPLRRAIANVMRIEGKQDNGRSREGLEWLDSLHARFEDPSLGARVQQLVGEPSSMREDQLDLKPLAEELLSTPGAIAEHLPWLTSGDASDSWRLGEALAAVDSRGDLAEALPFLPGAGRDLRLVCGYISARRQVLGDEWYDRWVASQFERDPRPIPLLFEVAWRCGVTELVARIVGAMLRSEKVSAPIVGQLAFGDWATLLSANIVELVLRAMIDTGHSETAIGILEHRMRSQPTEAPLWKPLALEMVTTSGLIRTEGTGGYHWEQVAKAIVADYPREIAAAIFREQAERSSGTWFVEHSEAAEVLRSCVDLDPSGTWQEIQPHLSSLADGYLFGIGFPQGVLERMPQDDVIAWVSENPEERAVIVAGLAIMSLLDDGSLASRILGMYGDNQGVASAFQSEYLSGVWSGPASAHWDRLAGSLEETAGRTALPKLRRWAADTARSLRQMAERDRRREEEEGLRRG